MNSTLTDRSASELLDLLAQRKASALEVVEAHIARIETVNPALNAVVYERFDRAREEARAADARRGQRSTAGDVPPLLGLPMTIKDAIDVEGTPTTGGLPARRDHRASEDATVVARLRSAGAIILGKTNTSTISLAPEPTNLLFGVTNNPYAPGHTAGGSSGGEAAILAAGGSTAGLGSDVGGSIRVPAHFCGVAGMKPTGLSVPQTGHFPQVEPYEEQFSIGPMARRVDDLVPLLRAIRGPDDKDRRVEPTPFEIPSEEQVRERIVCVVDDIWGVPVDAEIRLALDSVVRGMTDDGFHVRRHTPRAFRVPLALTVAWLVRLGAAGYSGLSKMVAGEGRLSLAVEIARAAIGRPRIDPFVLKTLVASRLPLHSKTVFAWAERVRALVLDAVERATAGAGVILCPVFPMVAPEHGGVSRAYGSLRMPTVAPYTVFVNLCGLPGVTVPAGRTPAGLPFGLQIVGNRHKDGTALAVARVVERITGGYRPPEAPLATGS